MTQSLSSKQATLLGVVVVLALGVGLAGLFRIAGTNGLWSGTPYEVMVVLPDAQGIDRGTLVTVRGVEAGQVIALEDGDEGVRVTLHLKEQYRAKLFADASAGVATRGLMGSNIIAIKPGTAQAGPLVEPVIVAQPTPDLTEVAAKLNGVAGRLDAVLKDIHEGEGTLPKLLKDDGIYRDLKETTAETKKLVQNLDASVSTMRGDAQKTLRKVDASLDTVQDELGGLKELVRTGKDAATAIKQDAEAIKALPIVRNYVEDTTAILVKPTFTKDRVVYYDTSLFEPGTAILTAAGRGKLDECVGWLRSHNTKGSEVVIAAFANPKDETLTAAGATVLTKKQAETISEYFRERSVHKIGYVTRRKVTPVGLGFDPTPVVEKELLPAARIEVILFTPQ